MKQSYNMTRTKRIRSLSRIMRTLRENIETLEEHKNYILDIEGKWLPYTKLLQAFNSL